MPRPKIAPAPKMPDECCERCRFFRIPENMRLGMCRRFPVATAKSASEWCGEFEKRKQ